MRSLFHSFSEMIDGLPAAAVKLAAANERRMLEEDMAMGREGSLGDVTSILTFCRFLESPDDGLAVFSGLPLEHWAFYAKTVHRLVEAGELPTQARDQVDEKFDGILSAG